MKKQKNNPMNLATCATWRDVTDADCEVQACSKALVLCFLTSLLFPVSLHVEILVCVYFHFSYFAD